MMMMMTMMMMMMMMSDDEWEWGVEVEAGRPGCVKQEIRDLWRELIWGKRLTLV